MATAYLTQPFIGLTCSEGCGTSIEARVIALPDGLYCELCGAQHALRILDDPDSSPALITKAEVALCLVRTWRRIDLTERVRRRVHETPITGAYCTACDAEHRGFPGPWTHSCGRRA